MTSPERINYTIVGDIVNVSQRLEALGVVAAGPLAHHADPLEATAAVAPAGAEMASLQAATSAPRAVIPECMDDPPAWEISVEALWR